MQAHVFVAAVFFDGAERAALRLFVARGRDRVVEILLLYIAVAQNQAAFRLGKVGIEVLSPNESGAGRVVGKPRVLRAQNGQKAQNVVEGKLFKSHKDPVFSYFVENYSISSAFNQPKSRPPAQKKRVGCGGKYIICRRRIKISMGNFQKPVDDAGNIW